MDKEIKDIFLNIFPQLKHYQRIERIGLLDKELQKKIKANHKLAALIIDKSDNYEYFCYKYKVSNRTRNNFECIFKNFNDLSKENFLSEKNIKKTLYYYDKEYAESLIIFYFFINSKITNKELNTALQYLDNCEKPIFPISGDLLKDYGFETGEKLGKTLKKIENYWVSNEFNIDKKTIEKLLKN